jgi:DNA-binding transcriptional MerR regulator
MASVMRPFFLSYNWFSMSQKRYLRTSDLARAADVHPNTVRLYEQWGLLPPVERDPFNGYRRFTQAHLDQILLVRKAMKFNWLSGGIRATAYDVMYQGAASNLGGALELAYRLVSLVQAEEAQAEVAVQYLQRWVAGVLPDSTSGTKRIGDVANLLDVTIDQIRNWERNGLIDVPRNPSNGYRCFGPREIGRLRVIRMLLKSRYSMMAILRMMNKLDAGETDMLREALDTPEPEEDILYVTDHWLTTLTQLEQDAGDLVVQVEMNLAKQSLQESDSHLSS